MRTLLGSAFLLALVMWPAALEAQRRGAAPASQKEFGVDVGIAWYDPDGGEQGIRLATPLDVRVGFVPRAGQNIMWEGRFSLAFDSKGGSDAAGDPASLYVFTPGVNLLYASRPGGHRTGMYFTGGAGLNLVDVGELGGAGFSLNGAVGWRKPYGSAALRYEVGLQWDSEIEDSGAIIFPSTLSIGARVGISLWR
ncbi:MAG: hypothetical protein ACREMJ_07755 [Gemmatimonadales bacterium]